MTATLADWLREHPERERVFAQERLITAVAESLWEQIERSGSSKAEIAQALGKSKAFVSQVLDGSRNMTLRTLSDIAFALGSEIDIHVRPKVVGDDWSSSHCEIGEHAQTIHFRLSDEHDAANTWSSGKAGQRLMAEAA